MKKRILTSVLLGGLCLAPLTSCQSGPRLKSLSFLVTYSRKSEIVVKDAVLVAGVSSEGDSWSAPEITEKTFRLDLAKIGEVKHYTPSADGSYDTGTVRDATEIFLGDILTLMLAKPAAVNSLGKYKFVDSILTARAANGARSGGTVKEGKVAYGDDIAFGEFSFNEIPFFVMDGRAVDPAELAVGTKGDGGYYRYGSGKKYRLMLPFVVRTAA